MPSISEDEIQEIRNASIASAERLVPQTRPRWMLHMQAQFWRIMMRIGMLLHRLAPPRPPPPAFARTVQTTISSTNGHFVIQFYVPADYNTHKRLRDKKYPCVVNFHGGGFTLGKATDDGRWCKTVVDECQAVVASVDYRLAPEFPFPIAVEDGADAVKYIALHADDLNIDIDRIALSGFSSGANMCFTVPLCLENETIPVPTSSVPDHKASAATKTLASGQVVEVNASQHITLRAVVSWYPPTDYTLTREQRRATCAKGAAIDHQLPSVFTNLFDESYLHPPTMDLSNPLLSPGVAPPELLAELPNEIVLFTCEWDMLLSEGEKFKKRLEDEVGKTVHYQMIPNVPHGWDKAPNPIKPTAGVQEYYLHACRHLRRILKSSPSTVQSAEARRLSVVR
jgi:putative ergosteryl-3beta-O-L-aspartate hydrolase